jgi:hypothetical protein
MKKNSKESKEFIKALHHVTPPPPSAKLEIIRTAGTFIMIIIQLIIVAHMFGII